MNAIGDEGPRSRPGGVRPAMQVVATGPVFAALQGRLNREAVLVQVAQIGAALEARCAAVSRQRRIDRWIWLVIVVVATGLGYALGVQRGQANAGPEAGVTAGAAR